MDTSVQLYETDATGWRRGLYDDVKRTFRVPFVFWIFRTTMANEPAFFRYAWSQIKPVFQTRAVEDFVETYRDAILSTVGEDALPVYRCEELGMRPPEYRELTHQVKTFDVGGPRLALLFHLVDTALQDGPVGVEPQTDRAATAPTSREPANGADASPTMISPDAVPEELTDTIESMKAFHGFEDGLPSVYRCLAQWPPYVETMWDDVEPVLQSESFDRARAAVEDLVADFVASTPYRPRLAPADLRGAGFDDEQIEGAQALFEQFRHGPVETVIPALPIYAYTLDASQSERP